MISDGDERFFFVLQRVSTVLALAFLQLVSKLMLTLQFSEFSAPPLIIKSTKLCIFRHLFDLSIFFLLLKALWHQTD